MSAKILAATGIGATGAVGGGVYLYISNNQQTHLVSNLLKEEKTRFALRKSADASHNEKWKAAWKRYREAHKSSDGSYSNKDTWGISNWSEKKGQEEVFDEFKDMCESKYKLSVTSKDDVEYQNVRKWCTGSKTVKELIDSEKERIILPESGDDGEWNLAWQKYRDQQKEGTGSTYKSSDDWGVTGWQQNNPGDSATTNYRSKCKEQYSKDIDFEKELADPLINQVVEWCTKPKNP